MSAMTAEQAMREHTMMREHTTARSPWLMEVLCVAPQSLITQARFCCSMVIWKMGARGIGGMRACHLGWRCCARKPLHPAIP